VRVVTDCDLDKLKLVICIENTNKGMWLFPKLSVAFINKRTRKERQKGNPPHQMATI